MTSTPALDRVETDHGQRELGARRNDRARLRRCLVASDSLSALGIGALTAMTGRVTECLVVALWWLFMMVRLDHERRIGEFLDINHLLRPLGWWLAFAASVGLFLDETGTSAPFMMVAVAVLFASSYITRLIARLPWTQAVLGVRLSETMLLVGERCEVARTLREWAGVRNLHVVGVCLPTEDQGPPDVEGYPVLGSARDIPAICARFPVDVVALHDCGDLGGRQLARLQWTLERTKTFVSLVTPIADTAVRRVHTRLAGRRLIVDLALTTPSGVVVSLRSMLDRLFALLLLMLTAPIMLASILAIKCTSPGPVFFKQVRVRENNRTFVMYKLRTMIPTAEQMKVFFERENDIDGGILFKLHDDPRVTKVGRILRRFSIDELPQLINVIKGEMALIGPRPALPTEVTGYDSMARRRLDIKPGLTGLWQVSGRSNLSWEESVWLDMDYVNNWSPRLDALIAMGTVKAVIRRDGAY